MYSICVICVREVVRISLGSVESLFFELFRDALQDRSCDFQEICYNLKQRFSYF